MPLLTLHKITCFRTNDIDHADELLCQILPDEQTPKTYLSTLLAGQTWPINTNVWFTQFVRIQLWENRFPQQPFFVGQTDIAAAVSIDGSFETEYNNGNGWYRLSYSIDIQPPSIEQNIDLLQLQLPDVQAGKPAKNIDRGLSWAENNASGKNRPTTLPPQTEFLPSKHGFGFPNYFTFQMSVKLPFIPRYSSSYGLCGGMVKAAADFYENQMPLPNTTTIPQAGSSLYKYLVKRQMQSFGATFSYLAKFFKWWMLYSTLQTQELTLGEWVKIKAQLDQHKLVQLGIIYVDHHQGSLWENHQVLAFAYEQPTPSLFYLKVYDPNYPKRDDIFIKAELNTVLTDKKPVSRLLCEQQIPGWMVRPVRGFFDMPVKSKLPPKLG